MLHVITEIGKPGKREREKRHFPQYHNKDSTPLYYARGRRYIPHGSGDFYLWRPHNQNVQVDYSYSGPDWESKLKYIPHPQSPRYPAAEIFPDNWHAMRPYPYTYMKSDREWTLDPDLTKIGLKCTFNGQHKATATSDGEITHQMVFGRGRSEPLIDKRNGIPHTSLGDKSYQVSEYSPDFHRLGSSLPVINFGTHGKHKDDTFVPLQSLPPLKRGSFNENQKKKSFEIDVETVRSLDNWKPATPLHMKL